MKRQTIIKDCCKRHANASILASVAFIPAPIVYADITGKVVAVADGDTITVLRDQEQMKIRLVEIDAPEKAQAFGSRSKQSLSDLCFGRMATLDVKGKDRYGRTLARVYCDDIDANAEQVRRGMAWVYRKYAPMVSPLYAVENEAKVARRGLWADAEPMPPWEWRRHK
ncbi:MAG: nuclease [Gallionellaceae bacterium]|nr:MAG: nuclease [Gallionellaceae bacterium]